MSATARAPRPDDGAARTGSGRTRTANLGLLENNARIAAGIDRELLLSDTAR